MTETKHTPGPWHSRRAKYPVDGEYDFAIYCEINGEPYVVGEAFGRASMSCRPNAEANSRVMAAAPDLLAALKVAMADFGQDYKGQTIDAMRAAIAKAEG